MTTPRILIWDIESSHLKADFGTVLAIGWKWLGEKKTHVLSLADFKKFTTDPIDDRDLIDAFVSSVYNTASLTITYNGIRFDLPYINAKCLEHDLPLPAPVPMLDVYLSIVRGKLALSRKSLQNVCYFLKLSNEKTPVEGRIWKRASSGHKGSLKYIVDHCKADVLVLEEAYMKLRPLLRGHPRVAGWGPCRYCGKDTLQSRGLVLSSDRVQKRRHYCSSCGGWESRPDRK